MVCPTAKQWRPIDFCSAGYSQHRDLDTHLRWDKRDAPLSSFFPAFFPPLTPGPLFFGWTSPRSVEPASHHARQWNSASSMDGSRRDLTGRQTRCGWPQAHHHPVATGMASSSQDPHPACADATWSTDDWRDGQDTGAGGISSAVALRQYKSLVLVLPRLLVLGLLVLLDGTYLGTYLPCPV